jgi:hypothetical protein
MKNRSTFLLTGMVIAFATIAIVACKKDEYKGLDCSSINAKYAADIKPIIQANCNGISCHGPGSSKGDITNYNGLKPYVDNGSLSNSVLTKKSMPPSGALSLDDRKKIKCWIDSGSPNN